MTSLALTFWSWWNFLLPTTSSTFINLHFVYVLVDFFLNYSVPVVSYGLNVIKYRQKTMKGLHKVNVWLRTLCYFLLNIWLYLWLVKIRHVYLHLLSSLCVCSNEVMFCVCYSRTPKQKQCLPGTEVKWISGNWNILVDKSRFCFEEWRRKRNLDWNSSR